MGAQLLINLDVPDLQAATAFYTQALGLTIGRQLGPGIQELTGACTPVYLLEKPAESPPDVGRSYQRHWTPVHLDWVVSDLDAALATALAAGAKLERGPDTAVWGRLAVCSDPFGHGFCLLQFLNRGYAELVSPA